MVIEEHMFASSGATTALDEWNNEGGASSTGDVSVRGSDDSLRRVRIGLLTRLAQRDLTDRGGPREVRRGTNDRPAGPHGREAGHPPYR